MTQTRKEALARLLGKVEAGNPAARDIAGAFGAFGPPEEGISWAVYNAMRGSLDAAKALHEAVMPRHYAQVRVWPVPEMCRVDIGGGHRGRDDNPARAWLIAILNALIAQEPDQ